MTVSPVAYALVRAASRLISTQVLLFSATLTAAQIPAGTELSIRLTDKIATETTKPQTPVHATLIVPVIEEGKVVLPLGVQLTGEVKQVKPAADKDRAQIELAFTRIGMGSYVAPLSATISALDNARETIDDQGVITGIVGSEAYGSRIDQGIAKLQNNDKLSSLAGLIQGAKQALKIKDVNANIDYDPGVEMTAKLTSPLDWRGPTQGIESKIQPFPNETALIDLVNRQPFRTVAENPPRPSDLTNIMLIATDTELRAAFAKAGWSNAVRLSTQSKLETARALIEDRGYKEAPMSVLLLEGQPPALAYQKGNDTFEKRHHLRIFARPGSFAGKPVWVCSATHDTGIDFSERDRTFIHKIDSDIDNERTKVVNDLLFAGAIRSLALVDRPYIPANATNATGDPLHTDGRMAVLLLQ
jgi:hypothetical protein